MDPPITSIGNIPQHVFPEKNHHFIGNEYVPSKSGSNLNIYIYNYNNNHCNDDNCNLNFIELRHLIVYITSCIHVCATTITGGTYELVNPITGKSWQEVAKGSEEEINAAVEAAESALDEWQALGYMGRQKILLKLADEWEANYKDLALLESATNGV